MTVMPLVSGVLILGAFQGQRRTSVSDEIVSVKVKFNKLPYLAYDAVRDKDGVKAVVWTDPKLVYAVLRAFGRTPQFGNPYLVSRCVFYAANDPMPRYAGFVGIEDVEKADRPLFWRYFRRTMAKRLDALGSGPKRIVVRTAKHRFAVPASQVAALTAELRAVPEEWVGAFALPVLPLALGGKARHAHIWVDVRNAKGSLVEVRLAVPRVRLESPGPRPSALMTQLLRAYRSGDALPEVTGADHVGPYPQNFPPPAGYPFTQRRG